jgi:hypothetical protein
MPRSKDWLGPLTGVVFVALVVAAFALLGEGQDATKKSAQEIVNHYKDNKDEQFIGGLLVGLAGVFFLFFAGWMRKVLRAAEGPGGVLSAVAFGGAIVFVAGAAIGASIHITLADTADDLSPVAVQAINAIDWDYFIPFAVGMSAFLLATGLSAVRHGALPKWLGWIAIVIGVAAYTPAGFFAFLAGMAWILVASIVLSLRMRAAPAPTTAA